MSEKRLRLPEGLLIFLLVLTGFGTMAAVLPAYLWREAGAQAWNHAADPWVVLGIASALAFVALTVTVFTGSVEWTRSSAGFLRSQSTLTEMPCGGYLTAADFQDASQARCTAGCVHELSEFVAINERSAEAERRSLNRALPFLAAAAAFFIWRMHRAAAADPSLAPQLFPMILGALGLVVAAAVYANSGSAARRWGPSGSGRSAESVRAGIEPPALPAPPATPRGSLGRGAVNLALTAVVLLAMVDSTSHADDMSGLVLMLALLLAYPAMILGLGVVWLVVPALSEESLGKKSLARAGAFIGALLALAGAVVLVQLHIEYRWIPGGRLP